VTFLAEGVGSILGSFVGGSIADRAAKRFSQAPEGRMVYSLAITSLCMPCGLLLLGFGLQAHMHIAVLLAASFFVGFGLSSLIPGVYSFVSCVDQAHAGCATAALNTAWCSLAGLMVLLSVPGVGALGVAGCLCLLAGIHMLCVAVAAVCTLRMLRG
jgi:MFS family permease